MTALICKKLNSFSTAMVHAGMGEWQVNGFLSSLNIPAVSHKTLSARKKEMGDVVSNVAKESTRAALNEEIMM